jgi:hypothetical protein
MEEGVQNFAVSFLHAPVGELSRALPAHWCFRKLRRNEVGAESHITACVHESEGWEFLNIGQMQGIVSSCLYVVMLAGLFSFSKPEIMQIMVPVRHVSLIVLLQPCLPCLQQAALLPRFISGG